MEKSLASRPSKKEKKSKTSRGGYEDYEDGDISDEEGEMGGGGGERKSALIRGGRARGRSKVDLPSFLLCTPFLGRLGTGKRSNEATKVDDRINPLRVLTRDLSDDDSSEDEATMKAESGSPVLLSQPSRAAGIFILLSLRLFS